MTESVERVYSENIGPSWHPATVHVCQAFESYYARRPIYHVALRPRRPGQTILTDLQDAGYRVLDYGVRENEVPECDVSSYPRCEHVILLYEW